MTREEIINLIKDNLQYECYNGFGISEYSINTAEICDKADTLLSKIEQEKKEQAREIFAKIYNEIEYYSLGQIAIRQLAKEYGVEL